MVENDSELLEPSKTAKSRYERDIQVIIAKILTLHLFLLHDLSTKSFFMLLDLQEREAGEQDAAALSSSMESVENFRRGKFFALFLVSTATATATATAYSSTYKFTLDCTWPGPYTYSVCP